MMIRVDKKSRKSYVNPVNYAIWLVLQPARVSWVNLPSPKIELETDNLTFTYLKTPNE